ncbi:MAG: hypothetical protein ACLUOI_35460 [Eisenbergiella sp.]
MKNKKGKSIAGLLLLLLLSVFSVISDIRQWEQSSWPGSGRQVNTYQAKNKCLLRYDL